MARPTTSSVSHTSVDVDGAGRAGGRMVLAHPEDKAFRALRSTEELAASAP